MFALKNKISIGTVQFAVTDAENVHFLQNYPLGSISRWLPEFLSNIFVFLDFDSVVTKLMATNPEKEEKNLIYTSMLPSETVQKILKQRHFDYFLYGEISFSENPKVEISLLENGEEEKMRRRVISFKNNNPGTIVKKISEEVLKMLRTEIDLKKISFLEDLFTDNLKAWGWYAISFEEEMNDSEKEEALIKAIEFDQDFLAAKLSLISLWLENVAKKNEAILGLNKLESKITTEILNYFGKSLFNQEKMIAASHFFEASLAKKTEQKEIISLMLRLSHHNNDLNLLKKYLNFYLKYIPEFESDFDDLVFYTYLLGDTEKAIQMAEKVIKNKPSAKLYSTLGFIHLNQKKFSQAAEFFEKSFSLVFSSGILEDWSASLLQIKEFEKVLVISEKYKYDLEYNSGVECNQAIALLNLDRKAEAKSILCSAIEKDPNNHKIVGLLANIYIKEKNYHSAEEYLKKTISLDQLNPFWQKLMGDIYYESGKINQAVEIYKKTVEALPELKISRYLCYQAEEARRQKKYQEALDKCLIAAKAEPDNWQSFNLMALILLEIGEEEKAQSFFYKALEKDSDNPEIWSNLYSYYQKKAKGFFKKKWKIKAREAYLRYNEYKEKYGKETKIT